jgi:hypothetical protein
MCPFGKHCGHKAKSVPSSNGTMISLVPKHKLQSFKLVPFQLFETDYSTVTDLMQPFGIIQTVEHLSSSKSIVEQIIKESPVEPIR